jgi:transposase-like protein
MYAKGITQSDISGHVQETCGFSVSDSTVSRITDKVLPAIREWQTRPFKEVYAVVFLDAVHYY